MNRQMRRWKLANWVKLLPVLYLYQSLGCLPDGAFGQVLGENLLLTTAIIIQTMTSILFNGIFGAFT